MSDLYLMESFTHLRLSIQKLSQMAQDTCTLNEMQDGLKELSASIEGWKNFLKKDCTNGNGN